MTKAELKDTYKMLQFGIKHEPLSNCPICGGTGEDLIGNKKTVCGCVLFSAFVNKETRLKIVNSMKKFRDENKNDC